MPVAAAAFVSDLVVRLHPIIEGTAQFHHALHERVLGNKCIRPKRLDQLLFADEPAPVFQEIQESIVDLRAKLYVLASPDDGPAARKGEDPAHPSPRFRCRPPEREAVVV